MTSRNLARCRPRRRLLVAGGAVVVAVAAALPVAAAPAAAPNSSITVLPCRSSPLSLTAGVSLACPTSTLYPGLQSHVATITVSATGPRLGMVPANGRIFQYQPATDNYVPDQPVSQMTPATAVLGVNGGYFDINQNQGAPYTGSECGGAVQDGRILKTPPTDASAPAQLSILTDGTLRIGAVGFIGTLTDGALSHSWTSINDLANAGPQQRCPPDLVNSDPMDTGITLITPDMGVVNLPALFQIPNATVVYGTRLGTVMQVTGVTPSGTLSHLPQLVGDQVALVASELASGAGSGPWLAAHVHQGDSVSLIGGLTVAGQPVNNIQTLVSGSAVLAQNNKVCTPQAAPSPCGVFPTGTAQHAETMVGVSADGHTAYLAVTDDPKGGRGLSPQEDGQYLLSLGAASGILFDGGGSSTMVARTSPSAALELVNDTHTSEGPNNPQGPGNQRYVANAIVVFPAAVPPPSTTTTHILTSATTSTPKPTTPKSTTSKSTTSKSSTPKSITTHPATLTQPTESPTPLPGPSTAAPSYYPAPALAATGADQTAPLTWIAGGLLVTGAALIFTGRRRRKNRQIPARGNLPRTQ